MELDAKALTAYPHRRLNPLTGEWTLVSPHRTKRPWQGQIERVATPAPVAYDPKCYLCPGNERAAGRRNPQYESTFVFDNDFPALLPDALPGETAARPLLRAVTERGLCRVVCFSPNHGLAVPRMDVPALTKVVDTWADQTREIGALPFIGYVQIFENRGEMMGASNPHPHCQIWAVETIPNEVNKEVARQGEWRDRNVSCLLCDYLKVESREGARIVCANDTFIALVPFWAVWPFETMVLPARHVASLDELTTDERRGLADILRRVTIRYDNLFESPFPYTMGFHQTPTDGVPRPGLHLHAHYLPPLLRSATVRKFMVGFELLGSPGRDITPESAAERLRALSEVHYLDRTPVS